MLLMLSNILYFLRLTRVTRFTFYTHFYSILYIFTILNYFDTKHFILYNIISIRKRGRPFPSCDVVLLNSCFYGAWWWLHKPKLGRSVIFNKAKKSVGRDWFFSEELKYIYFIIRFISTKHLGRTCSFHLQGTGRSSMLLQKKCNQLSG
jgi:hypothetical protein